MPQRCTCRQSTLSAVGIVFASESDAGAAPSSSALTISPVCRPMASKFGITPPTAPMPMKVLKGPYSGAVDTAAMASAEERGVKVWPSPSLK